MTLQWLWWAIVAVSLASLGYNVAVRRRYRSTGAALPHYYYGNISGGVGMILLSGFYLLGASGPLAILSLSAACTLIVLGIAQGIAGRRRRP